MSLYVQADPYPCTYDGDLRENTAPVIIKKPGKDYLCAPNLELLLHKAGIRNLILNGIITDMYVPPPCAMPTPWASSVCCKEDCCGATDPDNHMADLKMVKMLAGVFGAVATSQQLLATWT